MMALSISIAKNIPETDSPINFVDVRSLIPKELSYHLNVP
jgi:hypothetical protein